MKKFAVVLSGCGFKDGSEITEAVSTLIALSQNKIAYQIFAPDIEFTSTNHKTGQRAEKRNTLIESARIARGHVTDIRELNVEQFDAVVFPGGYGAAQHLCEFATHGAKAKVHPEVRRVIEKFYSDSKPIGAFCIAPALIACVLGKHHVTVTIGNDAATASEIKKTSANHVECAVDDYTTDRENKVVTTPAYMYDAKPDQVFLGIQRAIRELAEMA